MTWPVRPFAASSSWPGRRRPAPASPCTPWVPPTGGWRRACSVRDLPELATDADPVALERAMADCVRQVRRAASRGRARREIGELLAASGGLDPERDENVAARLRRLLEEERESPE